MKYADKSGARYVVVIGDDELDAGKVSVKDMASGDSVVCNLDRLAEAVK